MVGHLLIGGVYFLPDAYPDLVNCAARLAA